MKTLMKKLFLLPVIALVAVLTVTLVSAYTYTCYGCTNCDCSGSAEDGTNCYEACSSYADDNGVYSCGSAQGGCANIPEFTTIGAGIALLGAGAGYLLIRKKRK